MTDLQELKAGLAEKLAAKQKAEFSVEAIEGQFAEELSKWLELNPEVKTLHEQLEKAKEEKKAADTAWKDSRKEAATELVDYFDEYPEDQKKVAGLSFKRFIKPVYEDDIDFIKAVVGSGMYFLLQPDEKAIMSFVKGMADDVKGNHVMPGKVFDCLPVLTVTTELKSQISDKDLLK